MSKPIEEMIFNYVRATWYESKCKDKDEIKRIIKEELKRRPNYMDMDMAKLCFQIKKRCMAEL